MLITGKMHDYYDSASAYGIDKTIVYNRAESRLPCPTKIADIDTYETITSMPSEYYSNKDDDLKGRILLFCGEVYPFVIFMGHYFYSESKLIDAMNANKVFIPSSKYSWWNNRHDLSTYASIKRFFATKDFDKLSKLHHIHKSPVILVQYPHRDAYPHDHTEYAITLNPLLKSIGFQTQKDPFTVFQCIQSYISGVIGIPEKPMVKVSDKDLAAKRGHDGPYSFKKTSKGRWR